MTGYVQVLLSELISNYGEEWAKQSLSSFSCPLNGDVENFLKYKSIEFSKQGLAQTHLVYTSFKNKTVLIGYYTLANKYLIVKNNALSSNLKKKIKKFTTYDRDLKAYILPAPLIAQFSKNFYGKYNSLISGSELLKMACDKIHTLQQDLGGKIVYLECEDVPNLTEFYTNNGFYFFNKRLLEKDETELIKGKYLIQMLKYFKS